MKRLYAVLLTFSLLLTGCSIGVTEPLTQASQHELEPITSVQAGNAATTAASKPSAYLKENPSTTSTAPKATTEPYYSKQKTASKIEMHESGGEDGRSCTWLISQTENRNTVRKTEHNMREIWEYEISEQELSDILSVDFTDYIGQTNPVNSNICDEIYYQIRVTYADSTSTEIEVCVPELIEKLYQVCKTHQPVITDFSEPVQQTTVTTKTAETKPPSNQYTYKITENSRGSEYRGFYLDEEEDPDSPLYVYINSGEKPSGGYSISVEDISAEGDFVTITLKETAPAPDQAVICALTYPACMVTVTPKPDGVTVRDENGAVMECGEMRWRDAQKTDIIYDSEYHTKYVKNQIIVHVSEETKKYQMRQIAAELNADIIGILEHKGDYQLAFRNDKSLKELYELADRLNAYSFVETAAPYILETESASVSADKGDDMVLKGH